MKKILCFLGLHDFTKYVKLTKAFGSPIKDCMYKCNRCQKTIYTSEKQKL